MKLNRKTQSSSEISTSSLPDIIFMLLIFFMVTTVMREFEGLEVVLPRAKNIEKLENLLDDLIDNVDSKSKKIRFLKGQIESNVEKIDKIISENNADS